MQPPGSASHAVERETRSVHNWRVSQLNRLGVRRILAEVYADRIDWHQIARLIQQGCPPEVALRIVG
jgi:hypothetical protein